MSCSPMRSKPQAHSVSRADDDVMRSARDEAVPQGVAVGLAVEGAAAEVDVELRGPVLDDEVVALRRLLAGPGGAGAPRRCG